jgi:hypothetical protein
VVLRFSLRVVIGACIVGLLVAALIGGATVTSLVVAGPLALIGVPTGYVIAIAVLAWVIGLFASGFALEYAYWSRATGRS